MLINEKKTAKIAPDPATAAAASPAPAPAPASDDFDDWDDDEPVAAPTESANAPLHTEVDEELVPQFTPPSFTGEKPAIGGDASDTSLAPGLVCCKCSFPVLRFQDRRWDASVDYFHLRNYMPDQRMTYNTERANIDAQKLKAKLEPAPGCAAYACGCTWQSVVQRKEVSQWGTPCGEEGGAGEGGVVRWKFRRRDE